MERLLLLIAVCGVVYLSLLVFVSSSTRQERYALRLGIKWASFGEKLENERLQQLLYSSGLSVSAGKITIFRYSAALIYLAVQAVGRFVRVAPFSGTDLLVALLILMISSPMRYLPFGWLLAWLHQKTLIQKDGELISFIRLYENNRLRKRGYVQFGAFCAGTANQFYHIRQDLFELSERAVDEGTEKAIEWFCSKFPEGHAFINDIRSILLATEGMDDDTEAANYLREQGKIITKISSDQYLKKWSFIGDVSTLINVIPSIATFLMIVSLAMQYIMLIKGNFNGVGMFQ
ncbi:hypothetical protein R70723_05905 [Paenibacillus sp. FSL R7-0273]|uniref:hypothetical protein n=1 Tax=Paenibacillus sp. FSL R7-0273 TaxID=1536772 RepID=UPI0004F5BE01|nr:hypothetical protein [Paenibacillus sp. FSL R7-0273]AIQ45481.1 hypothetical protein R70723_05905 [Paenibacillus sp. FSL R7-0273]OMF89146.1 hypothetical protein BK144_20275 [Paenibacillus sp. FSL R7-0273]